MDGIPKRNYSQYSLITTFIFELQSTSNLTTLGFEDVPVYVPTPPIVKPPRTKKEPKVKKSQAEVEDEDDDDGTSTVTGLEEPKKDGNMASDSEDEPRWVPKSKASKSQSIEPKPKPAKATKPKASLTTFGPPSTTEDVLKSVMPYKPATPPSKEEASKSLSFSRANLFSGEPVTNIQNSSNKTIKESASLSTLDIATATSTEAPKTEAMTKSPSTPAKGLVLHGEVGGPARRAFLARGEPQDIDSQPTSKSQVDLLLGTVTDTIKLPFENNFTAINRKTADSEVDRLTRPASPVYESPEFEPLTPPASNRKPLPGRDDFEPAYRLLNNASQSFSFSRSLELHKSTTLSQATTALTTASTQDVPIQSGRTAQHVEPSVDLDKVVEDLEAMSRKSATQRAASPALSEATEVADPMEVMESVRNIQRDISGNSDFQREITDYYQNVPTPSSSSSLRQIEKRKADAMDEGEKLEGGYPQKVQKALGLEQKMMAAKAKFAAATERNHGLEKERRAALEVKKQKDEV